MSKEPVRYEDAAEQVTITKADGSTVVGWMPKGNTNVVWLEEHQGRYYAATDFPCACGGRHERGWKCCYECRHKRDMERWDESYKNAVPWDGKEVLCEADGDRFFFDADSLGEYLYERMEVETELEDIRLVHCKPDCGSHFEISEFLQDSLPEDKDLDEVVINKTVNDWIAANGPFSYWPDMTRPVLIESIRELWEDVKKDFEEMKS